MAFGKGKRYGDNTNLLYFKIKSKDQPKPFFIVTKKDDSAPEGKKYVVVDPHAERVSGTVIDIVYKEGEYDGKKIKSHDLVMQDGNDVYSIGIPLSYLGRNVLNSVFALKAFEDVEIALYQSKPREGQTKTFPSVATRQGGELVRGRFEKEQLPPIPKVKVGENTFSDDAEINAFFIKEAQELKKRIKAANEARAKAQPAPAATSETHGTATSAEDASPETPETDDLPF